MYRKLTLRLWVSRLTRYLLIPAAMIVVLLPLYGIFHQQTVKAQMTDAAEQLSASVSTFEGYLYNTRFVTNRLFHDSNYHVLAASTEENRLWDSATVTEASVKLDELTYSMAPVSYSYVTFGRNPLVVDDSRFYSDYDSFYPNVLEYPGMTQADWEAQLHANAMTCLPAQQVVLYRTAYPDTYLTISQPFFDNNGRYMGTCTMLLRERQLISQFLPYEAWQENCLFYIAGNDGRILVHNRYDAHAPLEGLRENAMHSYNGVNYLFVTREITGFDAVAVLGIPYSVYGENLDAVNHAIWNYIIAGVALCLVLSVGMTLLDLRQLSPVLNTLGNLEVADSRLLHDAILHKLQTSNQLSLELEKTRSQRDHSRMDMLLKTGIVNTPADYKHLCEQLRLTDRNYLLLIPGPAEAVETVSEDLRLMLVAEKLHQCYGREPFIHNAADGSVLAVLPLEQDTEEARQRLYRQTRQLHTLLNSPQPLVLSAEFSRLEQLSAVYWQVRNAQSRPEPEQTVCFLQKQTAPLSMLPEIAALEQLSVCLLSGLTDNAQTLIRQLLERNTHSLDAFRQSFYSVRGVLLNTAEKVACEDITYLCFYDPRQPTGKLIENLCECCLAIGSHVDSVKQSHNRQLQQDILQWLEENYARQDLNLAMVADQFHISKKYVSQFLKDQTGKSYNEYLEELRLGHAMELLKTTSESVTDIAVGCGFSSQNTFYKAFRRRYDMSPSAVRRDRQITQ